MKASSYKRWSHLIVLNHRIFHSIQMKWVYLDDCNYCKNKAKTFILVESNLYRSGESGWMGMCSDSPFFLFFLLSLFSYIVWHHLGKSHPKYWRPWSTTANKNTAERRIFWRKSSYQVSSWICIAHLTNSLVVLHVFLLPM